MPNAGEVRYTDGRRPTPRRGEAMKPADPDLAAQAKAAVEAGVGTGAIAGARVGRDGAGRDAAPATTDPAAPAQAPAAATTTATAQPQPQPQPRQPAVAQQTPRARPHRSRLCTAQPQAPAAEPQPGAGRR